MFVQGVRATPAAPARRDAFERSVATAATKFAHGEIEAGLEVLEAATTDLPVPPLPSKQYPPCVEHDIALVRELTSALREALQRGGGGAPMMDAIGRVFVEELDHPLEAPLHDYAMRILEQEIKTAPDVVACGSAVRWLEGHARRGGRVPPLAADLHRRFRHRLVCHQPCDAPRPS